MKDLKHIGIHLTALTALYVLFLFFPLVNQAQTVNTVYIFPGASLVAHPNSNLNIFSDISHSGSLTSYDSSFINFYGTIMGAVCRMKVSEALMERAVFLPFRICCKMPSASTISILSLLMVFQTFDWITV